MILVLFAHPYPHRSRAGATLLDALEGMPGLEVRSLYELYPDYDIDVAAERAAIDRARLVVWMNPIYWYMVPSLMNYWLEKVLITGFAFGGAAERQLAGKDCLWVVTGGGTDEQYTPEGIHGHAFDAFLAPLAATARYTGMRWLDPFVVLDAENRTEPQLREAGAALRARLEAWSKEHR